MRERAAGGGDQHPTSPKDSSHVLGRGLIGEQWQVNSGQVVGEAGLRDR